MTKSSPSAADKDDYHGHRKRLRQKFIEKGDDSLFDYEILEMLLFSAFPRKDVKPLAKKLLRTFGNFSNVLSADIQRLVEVEGIGEVAACHIKIVQTSLLKMLKDDHVKRSVLSNWQSLNDYLRLSMRSLKVEQLRVLYLNASNELISDDILQEGTINATPVYPREIIRRGLDLGATAFIMVHNHPSGNTRPSKQDIEMTLKIQKATASVSLILHDHIIVGHSKNFSLKSAGYL